MPNKATQKRKKEVDFLKKITDLKWSHNCTHELTKIQLYLGLMVMIVLVRLQPQYYMEHHNWWVSCVSKSQKGGVDDFSIPMVLHTTSSTN